MSAGPGSAGAGAGGARRCRLCRRRSGPSLTFLHRRRGLVPYLLLAPGLAWLALFFVVPLGFLGHQSLEEQDPIDFSYAFRWAWHNYS
jgi:hypothetical protein